MISLAIDGLIDWIDSKLPMLTNQSETKEVSLLPTYLHYQLSNNVIISELFVSHYTTCLLIICRINQSGFSPSRRRDSGLIEVFISTIIV